MALVLLAGQYMRVWEAAKHPFDQEVLTQWRHQDGAVADR
jgi:hypothetical protein